MYVSQKEKEILRALATEVAEYAVSPLQDKKRKLWTLHNDLKTQEPIVFIEPENGWYEIFTSKSFLCESEIARGFEMELRKRLFHAKELKDDFVIDTSFNVPFVTANDGWGVPITLEGGQNGGAYHIKPAIEEYEDTFHKLHFPNYSIDNIKSADLLQQAQETFEGILDVRQHHQWWWSLGLTWWYIDLRGLENFLCDFLIEPEWVHRTMNFLCEGTLNWLDDLEKKGLLFSNTSNHLVGSGGFGFTEELKQSTSPVCAKDMWGFVESQETSSISPELYGEFIFPYHKKIAQRFGLNCYGCCEAFEERWEYVSQLPNLRRISCSPWSNRKKSAELLDKKYISSYKLSPSPLSYSQIDEAEVRRNLRDVLDNSKGTIPELIMKDNHTLGNNPYNAIRWVELAKEEIANT